MPLAVLLRGDLRAAQALAAQKGGPWRIENEASGRHLRDLRERRGGAHGGDVYLRILHRVHSHLAAIAYALLERAGLLQDRLVDRSAVPLAARWAAAPRPDAPPARRQAWGMPCVVQVQDG